MMLEFEWYEEKARRNELKHGVTFEEAKTVFNDPFAVTRHDPDHSQSEDRWLDVGLSAAGQLLVVWYTFRSDTIRIIGVRRATSGEARAYVHERS
jgi:uncharacterized DUF497 family protein